MITVIGVLAAITIIAFNGVAGRANDNAVISDVNNLESLQTEYALKNDIGGKAWFSQEGVDLDLRYTPTGNNIIDVVANETEYCVRAYNPSAATYRSLIEAYQVGSDQSSCAHLLPSMAAVEYENTVLGSWSMVTGGDTFSCGIYESQPYCWGGNVNGTLGNGLTADSPTPVQVTTSGVLSGKAIVDISGGFTHTCALDANGLAYCWGSNTSGQLGDGTTTPSLVPVAVNTSGLLAGKNLVDIEAGNAFTCGLSSDGLVFCWGSGLNGRLGNGLTSSSSVPVAVTTSGVLAGKKVIKMDAASTNGCVVASDNLPYCWGTGGSGQLGNGVSASSTVPVAVSMTGVLQGKTIKSIAAGETHTCVVASDNLPYCWGSGVEGRLGDGTTTASSVPVAVVTNGVLAGKTIKLISAGGRHTCVIASDYRPYCWGQGSANQLGFGNAAQTSPIATTVSGALSGKTLRYMNSGTVHTCVVDTQARAYCWGFTNNGRLGAGVGVIGPVGVINP